MNIAADTPRRVACCVKCSNYREDRVWVKFLVWKFHSVAACGLADRRRASRFQGSRLADDRYMLMMTRELHKLMQTDTTAMPPSASCSRAICISV